MKRMLSLIAALAALACSAAAQDSFPCELPGIDKPITPEEAVSHVGTFRAVCGFVAQTSHFKKSDGRTHLNFVHPYPDQPFAVVFWNDVRRQFRTKDNEGFYLHKQTCVIGNISTYRNKPQIKLAKASHLMLKQEYENRAKNCSR